LLYIHEFSIFQAFFIQINTTFVRLKWDWYFVFSAIFFYWYNTPRSTIEAGTAYPSGAHEFTFGVCDTRSLVLCAMFCWPLFIHLSFLLWSLCGCRFSIYGFWLSLWYVQTRLI